MSDGQATVTMSPGDNAKMQTSPEYPSPSAIAMGAGTGPFFTQPPQLEPSEDLHLAAHSSRSTIPLAGTAAADAEESHRLMPQRQGGPLSDQLGATEEDPNDESVPTDSTTPRKRSKVSRACDECRRKKVSPYPLQVRRCYHFCTGRRAHQVSRYGATQRLSRARNPAPAANEWAHSVNSVESR
jgi:hypothetical protein